MEFTPQLAKSSLHTAAYRLIPIVREATRDESRSAN
jgi:hypothetical protein